MHSIERYGIVALLFLVVTVVAVLMWDGGKAKPKQAPQAGRSQAPVAFGASAPEVEDPAGRRLSLVADAQPGPLTRSPAGDPAKSLVPEDAAPARPSSEGPVVPAQAEFEALAPEKSTPSVLPAPETVVGALPSAAARTYTVQAGETLSEIAQRELGSSKRWPEIVALNPGLDPARVRSGKAIQLPGGQATAASSTPTRREAARAVPASAPAAGGNRTHTVEKGENLWRIAEKTLGDGKRWKEIAALNPKVNPDKLVLGQRLVVPVAGKSNASAPKAAPKKTASSEPLVAAQSQPERASRRGARVK